MLDKFYPQWRNENSLRRYPFEDNTSLISTDGSLTLLDDWLVDAAFFVRGATLPLTMSKVSISGDKATITITDAAGVDVGTGMAAKNSPVPIKILDAGDQWCGTLVPGSEANFPLFATVDGDYLFGSGDAEFVLSCCMDIPADAGLSAFTNELGQRYIASELILVGEDGIQLEAIDAQEYQSTAAVENVKLVRIHAMGNPQYLHEICTADSQVKPSRFIREVVFQYGTQTHICSPDLGGNILILADTKESGVQTALQILATTSGLVVRLPGKSI